MAEINLKAKRFSVILFSAISVFLVRLFPVELGVFLLGVELVWFMLSYALGLYFFRSTPFKIVLYLILGASMGIILDLLAFPTVNGFERNLFPIEILTHILIAAFLGYGLAGIFFLFQKFSKRKF